jgi:hypothetical protein
MFNVKAPRLLKVFQNAANGDKNQYPFGLIARLYHHIENLAMIINPSEVSQ